MIADRRPTGWYSIDADIDAPVAGESLVIKPGNVTGGGIAAEWLSIVVDTGGTKRLHLVFPLHHSVQSIEFLSDNEVLRNAIPDFDPQPVGKWRAVCELLTSRPGQAFSAGAGQTLRAGWSLLHIAFASGLAGIGSAAWRRYSGENGTIGGGQPYADLLLRRRVFGTSRQARLSAVSQLERDIEGSGGDLWRCTGDDPQFIVAGENPNLLAGWYWFECRVFDPKCRLTAPCFYPDYGRGDVQSDAIALPELDQEGRIRALVLLTYNVRSLRFDPTSAATDFGLQDCRLMRISKLRALWYLLCDAPSEGGIDWKEACLSLSEFVGDAKSLGLRQAVRRRHDRLKVRYEPAQPDYKRWVLGYGTLHADDFAWMREQVAEMADGPLISILLPVYQTPERWLRRCLDSVLEQVYPNWELCIADDASTSRHVRSILDEYVAKDRRIRVEYRSQNGHIAESSNTALQMACGEFVALLDHDDELPPHALFEIASGIRDNPQWQVIYSDEDKIDESGRRSDAYFKPDWNYDLLLSQNCVSHLGVYRTSLVRKVGGFRQGYEGSQDHDLTLRCIEKLQPGQIGHLPKVLYHWRKIVGSTALNVSEKNYAADAGRQAISDHLRRISVKGEVEVTLHGYYRVRYALPSPTPKVSLIIPTRDKANLLRMCVRSILEATDYPDFEILVVDNQSIEPETSALFEELSALPNVQVLSYDKPFNYSAINNHAARYASGQLLALINNDIEVREGDWLREMVSHACRPGVGAVGCMLYYPDDTIQHAGVITGLHGIAGHIAVGQPRNDHGYFGRGRLVQNLSAVTGACLIVRKQVYDEVGGLDEGLAVAFNDVDFCMRVNRAGYRNVWTPYAWAYHHESASRGVENTPEKLARFQGEVAFMERRWGDLLKCDPAYSPNLTLTGHPFQIAFPPRIDTYE